MPHPLLVRWLAMLPCCLALSGCGSLSGQGYLYTRDSQPLRLADDMALDQGHVRLEFNPEPMLLTRLRLHNERSDFSTWVYRGDYAGNSFFVDSQDSGLAYDIQAHWREQQAESLERDLSEPCTAPGYCSRTVRHLDCGRKTYREGSERYEEHEDDANCAEEAKLERAYFDNCPGYRQVRQRYQVYKLLVRIEFLEPFADRLPIAEFDGESRFRQRPLETLDVGRCVVN